MHFQVLMLKLKHARQRFTPRGATPINFDYMCADLGP